LIFLIFLCFLLRQGLRKKDKGWVYPGVTRRFFWVDRWMSVKGKTPLNNRDFRYRGEAEVQLLEREGVEVIETERVFFLSIGHFFSLKKTSLVGITLLMNQDQLDHYSFFSVNSTEKYGRPGEMNPQKALWEDDEVYSSP
jgi:hypothetical protein